MHAVLLCLPQAFATLAIEGAEPVLLGLPAPAAVRERGLRVSSGFSVQWRPQGARSDVRDVEWIQVAIAGGPGTARLSLGGAGPSDAGPVLRWVVTSPGPDRLERRWILADGTERARALEWVAALLEASGDHRQGPGPADPLAPGPLAGVPAPGAPSPRAPNPGDPASAVQSGWSADWIPGERRVEPRPDPSPWLRVEVEPSVWRRAGLLERPGRFGRELREHLARQLMQGRRCPGARGEGDYVRGPEDAPIVTNLEFDTALALAGLGLAMERRDLLERAYRAAWHTVTRDLDRRTGLPFPHGRSHRGGVPQPGHAWLQGLHLVGLLAGDEDLVAAAGGLARALARQPPMGEGREERLRDFAWPLWELEAWLVWHRDPVVERAADDLARAIFERYDAQRTVFRFGEGVGDSDAYFERAWLTGGILLPALDAHLARRPNARWARTCDDVRAQLLDAVLEGRPGLPLHYRIGPEGNRFATHRAVDRAEGWMLLAGLTPSQRQQALGRRMVRSALGLVPEQDDPDAATLCTMVGRNPWVWAW